jgi:uncharacterized protein (DUF1499 family)
MVARHTALTMQDLGPDYPTPLALWSRRIALFSLQVVLLALVLHRLWSLPTPVALNLFLAGLVGAALALLLGLAALVVIWRRGRGGAWSAAGGVLVSLLLFAVPAASVPFFLELPRMNDVTTDAQVPPRFVAAARLRPAGANPVAYRGAEFARMQAAAYPDIRPLVISRSATETFEILGETVRRLRWEIVAEKAPQGKDKPGYIEAVDRTLVLGFYDDVIVRVDGDQRESRIDIRSASRFGDHDLGRNAARIRGFFKELQARLEATVSPGSSRLGRRRARPDAAVPRRPKGAPAQSAGPRKSPGRAQQGAQREPQQKERQRSRAEDPGRDKRLERYPR